MHYVLIGTARQAAGRAPTMVLRRAARTPRCRRGRESSRTRLGTGARMVRTHTASVAALQYVIEGQHVIQLAQYVPVGLGCSLAWP